MLVLFVLAPASALADGCILMETGVDFILMEDGVSKILIEGGSACGGAAPIAVPQRMLMGVGQ
jgi:hypothetical protein